MLRCIPNKMRSYFNWYIYYNSNFTSVIYSDLQINKKMEKPTKDMRILFNIENIAQMTFNITGCLLGMTY
jgi:hypothetical protein